MKLKRIAPLLFLALFLTVGGVYATFNYAQGTVQNAGSALSKEIAQKVVDTPKGEIIVNSTFKITIDDTTKTLKTAAVYEGEFKVKFTPSTGADATVRDNGIPLKMTITATGNQYDGKAIFGIPAGEVKLNGANPVLGEITVPMQNRITVTEISLPTVADYDAYKAALDATTITITISEDVAP